jgi:hypothetical protein
LNKAAGLILYKMPPALAGGSGHIEKGFSQIYEKCISKWLQPRWRRIDWAKAIRNYFQLISAKACFILRVNLQLKLEPIDMTNSDGHLEYSAK